MTHPIDLMIKASRETARVFFKTEEAAAAVASDMADEFTTYKVEPYGGQFVLNAYDEDGVWMGRF